MNNDGKEKSADSSSGAMPKANEDPMILAKNYIESGQPEEAIYVLELAILREPGRRDLQDELLALYRSTYNEKGFDRFYNVLIRKRMILSEEWNHLKNFFKGPSDD
ncbi:MAG: type IV pilus assembly protein FimV [Gammaproteobacteria bacterium]